jgi:hypothetical protein
LLVTCRGTVKLYHDPASQRDFDSYNYDAIIIIIHLTQERNASK